MQLHRERGWAQRRAAGKAPRRRPVPFRLGASDHPSPPTHSILARNSHHQQRNPRPQGHVRGSAGPCRRGGPGGRLGLPRRLGQFQELARSRFTGSAHSIEPGPGKSSALAGRRDGARPRRSSAPAPRRLRAPAAPCSFPRRCSVIWLPRRPTDGRHWVRECRRHPHQCAPPGASARAHRGRIHPYLRVSSKIERPWTNTTVWFRPHPGAAAGAPPTPGLQAARRSVIEAYQRDPYALDAAALAALLRGGAASGGSSRRQTAPPTPRSLHP